MDFVKKQEGFTIIEIIIAIAILMIFLFAFMTLSTSSIGGIFGAGEKSSALFDAQRKIDREIDDGPANGNDEVPLTLKFNGHELPITAKEIEIIYEYDDHTGTLYYYYPVD